ncbi:MAG TPA: LacI family DNA-binding transcriptional regulator [Candidatus Hydrogenedentes bacterium]|nr:LacI family DNA-binding transcriptional regulator [Candidatus Hydrogenedentota bacterium]
MGRKAVTLREVALKAGVSPSTASRVLNNKPLTVPVTDKTRSKVLGAARALGYRPNRLARGLITARTNIIGIYLPVHFDLPHPFARVPTGQQMGFTVMGAQIAGVQAVTGPKDYDLHLFQQITDAEGKRRSIDLCMDFIDGLILPTPMHEDCKILQGWDLHTVCIEYNPPEFTGDFGFSSVYLDSLEEVYRVIHGWAEAGHRRIALILFLNKTAPESRYQLAAYKRALSDAGILLDERLVVEGSPVEDTGRLIAKRLLKIEPPPTAFFVGRADNAVSVLRGVKEAGKRCPEDVEIVSWCSDHAFEATEPQLGALDVPFHVLGMEAARLLCEEIEEGRTVSQRAVACNLIQRSSCRLRFNKEPSVSLVGQERG